MDDRAKKIIEEAEKHQISMQEERKYRNLLKTCKNTLEETGRVNIEDLETNIIERLILDLENNGYYTENSFNEYLYLSQPLKIIEISFDDFLNKDLEDLNL